MRPTMSPASTVKETRSSATTPPKRTLSSRTSSSDISGQVYKRTSPRGYYAVGPGASGGSDGHADASGSVVGSKGAGGGGVGLGGPCRVKLAHGYGCTLTHRRCRPGVSPGKGFMVWVKLPPTSVVALPATWLGSSQKSVMGSYARNPEPLTVIVVLGPPAAKSRTMLAPMGIGVGDGVGCGVGVGEGVGDTLGEGVTVLGVVVGPRLLTAVSANHAGKMTRTLSDLTRRPKVTSDRWPRDRPRGGRLRKPPLRIEHAAKPPLQHVHLRRAEQPVHCARQSARLEAAEGSLHVAAEIARQGLAREVPDHGPQLVSRVEREPVVDDPDAVVGLEQAVPRLAVGIVDDDVEQCDLDPGVAEQRLLAQEMPVVGVDEQLNHPNSVRAAPAHHCGRDARPADHLAELVGRDLSLVKGPSLEVPQWRLSTRRLVHDAKARWRMRRQGREEGVVGGSMQDSRQPHLGQPGQQALGHLGRGIRRSVGHRC